MPMMMVEIVPGQARLLLIMVTLAVASFTCGAQMPSPADDALAPETSPDANVIVDDGSFIDFVDGETWRRVRPRAPERGWIPPSGSAAANRIEFLDGDSLHEPVLWYGGRFQFMDICPEWGCLAVRFGTDGEAEHAWPLRPDALAQAARDAATDEFPHEPTPGFSFVRDAEPIGISQYPNGDLLVVFMNGNRTSPFVGAARIDRRGHPVWFRRDYSHHWPLIEDDGSALVLGDFPIYEPMSIPVGRDGTFSIGCPSNPQLDSVNVIDGDGRLLDSIDLVGAIVDSPFALVLLDSSHVSAPWRPRRCNPVHSNYVHRIADDAPDVWGMSPGDLVVSLRNVSAFAILDAESGRLKRLVRGSFRWQHSVQHWEGSRFLLFDNLGSDGAHGPSRLLMVDAADGRERTIFPNDGTPEALRGLFSRIRGKISISPDRRRALVVFTTIGLAVEVRLSDGAALSVFRSLHDVSGLEQFPEERRARPAVFEMLGLDYSFLTTGNIVSR